MPGVSGAPSGGTLPRPARLACRVVTLEGDVHLEVPADAGAAVPLLLQGLAPTEGWLALAASAHFTAKDPRTTRETGFRGPGRVRACVDSSEESWVASGGFDSTMGAGEAPGNEEWVVTPLGVVRYNAAKLSVDVRPREVATALTSGTAFVWPAEDARARASDAGPLAKGDDGWLRVDGGSLVLAPEGTAAGHAWARAAVARCASLGKDAHDLSATIMAGGADASTIIQQVSTRRLARAACAVASLRLELLPQSDASADLAKTLADGKAGWSTLPTPPP
jgi:hypothetical protein